LGGADKVLASFSRFLGDENGTQRRQERADSSFYDANRQLLLH